MKIKKVVITNFRTIKKTEFYFYPYMVFVGKNNSGKSNIMKALDVFFGKKPVEDDFRLEGKKREREITITLTFIDLLDGEKKLYQGNILFEGTKKAQVEIMQTIILQDKMKPKYEIAKLFPDLSTPAAKNRYGFLFDEGLISKKEFQEDPSVPDEFKQLMEEFIEKKKEKMKKEGKSPSSRLSKGDMISLKTQYTKQHPEISKLKMKKNYVKSKIEALFPQIISAVLNPKQVVRTHKTKIMLSALNAISELQKLCYVALKELKLKKELVACQLIQNLADSLVM
ncbi:hypothetical protein ES708_19868 [subsurface metagenome]